jgi:hypothetical protein
VPSVTLLGAVVTATNVEANIWQASRQVGVGTAEGLASFSITATDLTVSVAAAVTTVTDLSSVTVDTTAPVLSPATISSSHQVPTVARTGDVVTVSFPANESIQAPSVTLLGAVVTATNVSGTVWTATKAVTAGMPDGLVTFSITATDLAGNSGMAVTATTNASSVTVDRAAPVLQFVSIASNNANAARAKAGDTVTVTFTANEAVRTPGVMLTGWVITPTNVSGNQWQAIRVMPSNAPNGELENRCHGYCWEHRAGGDVDHGWDHRDGGHGGAGAHVGDDRQQQCERFAGETGRYGLSFTANDSIQTPSVTLFGSVVTATNVSGNVWQAATTVTEATPTGLATFSITPTDITGNATAAVTTTTDASSVTVDLDKPPVVATSAATSVTAAGARLAGTVTNPGGALTISFLYGTTTRLRRRLRWKTSAPAPRAASSASSPG